MAFLYGLAGLVVLLAALRLFLNGDPARIAQAIRYAPPVLLGALGLLATVFGRAGLGGMLLTAAAALFGRARQMRGTVPASSGRMSVVRALHLEMELDHDTGEMDGLCLDGPLKDVPFSMMDEAQWRAVHAHVSDDDDSRALFETYLDRKLPGWRDSFDTGVGDRERAAPGSGAMTEQEAYQILGLQPGAGPELIRKAHRRLMQRVHPDLGGTDFLAARINAAKDFLLSAHRKS
jgi:hypothetical protein